MNVEAIKQPGGLEGIVGRVSENGEAPGEFSGVLRGALDAGESTEGQASLSDRSAEEEAPKQDPESGTSNDRAAGKENAEELNASVSQETAVSEDEAEANPEENDSVLARVAAETGAPGELTVAQQNAPREGAGLEARVESEGRGTALEADVQRSAGERPAPPVEANGVASPGETAARVVQAQPEGDEPAAADAVLRRDVPGRESLAEKGTTDNAGREVRAESEGRESIAKSEGDRNAPRDVPAENGSDKNAGRGGARAAETQGTPAQAATPKAPGTPAQAATPKAPGEASTADPVPGPNAERGADVAATTNSAPDATLARADEAGDRAGLGSETNPNPSDREGSGESRDQPPPQQQERFEAEPAPSLAESAPAEAAAAYAASAATGEARAIEGAPVENGVAVAGPVAVTAPETASAPTAPTANAPQPAAASDAIAVQTEWLATRGGGSARLRLHPAELGEIEIRVTVRGGVVDVVMVAQEAVTKAIAEEQSERLAQAFASRDLRMDGFDVRRGDANGTSGDAPGDFAQSSQQGEDRSEREGQGDGREGGAVGQASGEPAQRAPVLPQILATGPEASVDLRI